MFRSGSVQQEGQGDLASRKGHDGTDKDRCGCTPGRRCDGYRGDQEVRPSVTRRPARVPTLMAGEQISRSLDLPKFP